MLRTEEFLDIEKIEQLRKACGRSLDEHDNFSWHVALKEGERLLGVARLYRFRDGLFLDTPCLLEGEKAHFEMLFRTLLLKALLLGVPFAYCEERKEYEKFGFAPTEEGLMMARREDITFPRECGRKDCCE